MHSSVERENDKPLGIVHIVVDRGTSGDVLSLDDHAYCAYKEESAF